MHIEKNSIMKKNKVKNRSLKTEKAASIASSLERKIYALCHIKKLFNQLFHLIELTNL